MKHIVLPLLLTLALACGMCTRRPGLTHLSAADSLAIVNENTAHRKTVDEFFRSDPGSPFRRDTTITFNGITWYPVDVRFRATSILHRYDRPETVSVMGTRGELRKNLKYGYFEFTLPGENGSPTLCRLNVYKFTPYDGQRYALYRDVLSVWFTDRTTGKETYEVGRYVEIGNEVPEGGHIYTIDLNRAYNPYCAYSTRYSCAVPRDEDRLDIAVRAGEMKYH